MLVSPGSLVGRTWPAVVTEELDVPVVETDGPQQDHEDEGQQEAEAGLVLVHQPVSVVVVVGVPGPVENNHTQGTCEEQYDEQSGGRKMMK